MLEAHQGTSRDEPAPVRFLDLVFDADFVGATRENGERLRFSRHDRAVLRTLARRPGQLFSRDQLLAAMDPDGESSDRNVDYVVNRLRRKLNDSARAPRYIATQYGEGYIWIAAPKRPQRSGFLVIGPLHGLDEPEQRTRLDGLLGRLARRLTDHYRGVQEVALMPDLAEDPKLRGAFQFSVGVDVVGGDGGSGAALTLLDEPARRVIRVVRCDLARDLDALAEEACETLASAIWRDLALAPSAGEAPGSGTLEIRMQDAALAVAGARNPGWRYSAARLERELAARPDDPVLALMSAVVLFVRTLNMIDFDVTDMAAHEAIERRIEALVLPALPKVRTDPLLALAAAKLLLCIYRGHGELVEELVAEARATGANFAAAQAVTGQLRAWRGDLPAALAAYDRALALCRPGSEFAVQLLALKARCLRAQGDNDAQFVIFDELARLRPADWPTMRLFALIPDETPPEAVAQVLKRLTPAMAGQLTGLLFFMMGRSFGRPEHARNVIAGPLWHLLPRFGRCIIPPRLPEPLDRLARELVAERAPAEAQAPGEPRHS
jgi:DNA-binding winged helix-turn-helix (wHTH) protein/tetratricopeptide (TPR) repeat protein